MMKSAYPVFHRTRPSIPDRERRQESPLRYTRTSLIICLLLGTLIGCRPSGTDVERLFGQLPKRNYDSIECSNFPAASALLGLAAVNHSSPVDEKLAYFESLEPFTFSAGEYSFLVSDASPLGFDPSDFSVTVVARTPSYSLTLVSGDFDRDTIENRLSEAGYRSEVYRGHTVYSLPWSDEPRQGGLLLSFANLVFVKDTIIASAPTDQLLKDYLDRIEVGTMGQDPAIMGLVERLKAESSFFISRGVRSDELYGEDSLFVRKPEDWGFPEYRLSPYTYFAFGISPAADRQHQRVTLLILYPDEGSAKNDAARLATGLGRGRSLSRLVPFSELFTVTQVSETGDLLTASIESKGDFDAKLLIRLKDLPFLVY